MGAEVLLILEGVAAILKALEAFEAERVSADERRAIGADIQSNREKLDRLVADAKKRLAEEGA
jgi:regulator of sirC expression with transglutaminase-like and TPR domain